MTRKSNLDEKGLTDIRNVYKKTAERKISEMDMRGSNSVMKMITKLNRKIKARK